MKATRCRIDREQRTNMLATRMGFSQVTLRTRVRFVLKAYARAAPSRCAAAPSPKLQCQSMLTTRFRFASTNPDSSLSLLHCFACSLLPVSTIHPRVVSAETDMLCHCPAPRRLTENGQTRRQVREPRRSPWGAGACPTWPAVPTPAFNSKQAVERSGS
jgi:hypothetical protein